MKRRQNDIGHRKKNKNTTVGTVSKSNRKI
jgi:hypothetical protein